MVLISFKMTDWHTVGLILISLLIMQGFIYAVEYSGHVNALSPDAPVWSVFLRYTVTGYAISLSTAFYILWTFGSIDYMPLMEQLRAAVVLGVPAAVGASASRLIL
jgi:putative integral membrane protein (TIGR02587 family)